MVRWISSELDISKNSVRFGLAATVFILVIPVIITATTFGFLIKASADIRSWQVLSDILYDTSGVCLVVIAAFALLTAIIQSRETVKTRKASVVIELEGRWSSAELQNSQVVYQELFREALNKLVKDLVDIETLTDEAKEKFYKYFTDPQNKGFIRKEINSILVTIRNSKKKEDEVRYHNVMGMAVFFEYIGFLVERRYLSIRDVDSLFGLSCIGYHDYIVDHIKALREFDRKIRATDKPDQKTTNSNKETPKLRVAFQNFSALVRALEKEGS